MLTSWKTTLAGILAGLPIGIDAIVQAANGGALVGKTGAQLLLAIGLILIGAYSKDHDVTGGTKPNTAVTNPTSTVITK